MIIKRKKARLAGSFLSQDDDEKRSDLMKKLGAEQRRKNLEFLRRIETGSKTLVVPTNEKSAEAERTTQGWIKGQDGKWVRQGASIIPSTLKHEEKVVELRKRTGE
jgi:hypothetical protein